MDLAGRSAVVTGAAGGIGAAVAAALLDRDASVVLTDRDDERLEATTGTLASRHPGRVTGMAGDGASVPHLEELLARAAADHGPVDLFVANAGVPGTPGLGAPEHWVTALEVNLLAHVRAAELLVPLWLERGGGHFASTASAAGLLTQLGSATYSVSKHAAVAFAEWLSVTYGDRGIGVTCLCPMGVETAMLDAGRESHDRTEQLMARAVTDAGEVLAPSAVARLLVEAIEESRFLVLPHPQVQRMAKGRAADHDRWIAGMRRYARTLVGD